MRAATGLLCWQAGSGSRQSQPQKPYKQLRSLDWAVALRSACCNPNNPTLPAVSHHKSAPSPIALHQLDIMEASLAQLAAVGGSQGANQLVGANLNAKLLR